MLTLLTSIARFVGTDQATVLHPLVLPMIDDCFAREEHIFFVAESLKAWLVFLRLSTAYNEKLAKLFIHAVDLSNDLENLTQVPTID